MMLNRKFRVLDQQHRDWGTFVVSNQLATESGGSLVFGSLSPAADFVYVRDLFWSCEISEDDSAKYAQAMMDVMFLQPTLFDCQTHEKWIPLSIFVNSDHLITCELSA